MRKPSPTTVIALLALFVALGGVGLAANGQSLVLGQSNSATSATSLSAPVAGGKSLALSNTSTTGGSTALNLSVAPGHAPLTVSPGAGKVGNLNADKLDGVDSSGFMQGKGRVVSNHLTLADDGITRPLLTLPGLGVVKTTCSLVGGTTVKSNVSLLNNSGYELEQMIYQNTDSIPGYIPVYSGQETTLNDQGSNRWVEWTLNKLSESSGPVIRLTTVEAVAQGGTCYVFAWAAVQTG
jgi:hypothetical protein